MSTINFKLLLMAMFAVVPIGTPLALAAGQDGDGVKLKSSYGMLSGLSDSASPVPESQPAAVTPNAGAANAESNASGGVLANGMSLLLSFIPGGKPAEPPVKKPPAFVLKPLEGESSATSGDSRLPVASQGGGLGLEDLIRIALQSYPTVLSKRLSKDAAESDLTAAKLKFLPSPTISSQQTQVTYSGQQGASRPATTIGLSQPLFMGGALLAGYDKAGARLSAAELGVLESRDEVSKRLISAYVEWVKAYRKILALEESVRLHEKFAALIKRRFSAGVASGADRDLGLSRLEQVKADLESQRSVEGSVLSTISELVGQPVVRQNLAGRLAKPLQIPGRQDGMMLALTANPTIQRYKFEAEAAEAEAREVRAQGLPQVLLQAQRQIGNTLVESSQPYNSVGLVVQYAPGGGLSSFASASAAFGRARALEMQIETARRDLTERLNADYNEFDFSRIKQGSLQHSVSLSGDISESYDRQYLLGRKSWLDLMTAVREQAQTRLALADAEASVLGASWRIAVSVGGSEPFETARNDH